MWENVNSLFCFLSNNFVSHISERTPMTSTERRHDENKKSPTTQYRR